MHCSGYCHIKHAFIDFRTVICLIGLGDDYFIELQPFCHMGRSDDGAIYESGTLTGQEIYVFDLFLKKEERNSSSKISAYPFII